MSMFKKVEEMDGFDFSKLEDDQKEYRGYKKKAKEMGLDDLYEVYSRKLKEINLKIKQYKQLNGGDM